MLPCRLRLASGLGFAGGSSLRACFTNFEANLATSLKEAMGICASTRSSGGRFASESTSTSGCSAHTSSSSAASNTASNSFASGAVIIMAFLGNSSCQTIFPYKFLAFLKARLEKGATFEESLICGTRTPCWAGSGSRTAPFLCIRCHRILGASKSFSFLCSTHSRPCKGPGRVLFAFSWIASKSTFGTANSSEAWEIRLAVTTFRNLFTDFDFVAKNLEAFTSVVFTALFSMISRSLTLSSGNSSKTSCIECASTVYATIFVCARTVALEVVDKPRMATSPKNSPGPHSAMSTPCDSTSAVP
mmetsp:Transcript_31036/g.66928  ORF Transcript_31036/g.66928 Transcript_31036/m.66928 type:complete len:303 (-) Transcript_31036:2046-2954(-)